ncbi:betaine--homocysteine S-methyltransferase 1-like [Saccoglossus kowalevskii]|uniref:Betaine--homocysteine S-methyltransferase 1-like n=1 Tax=Saccoglossus kowalevskii TaxID=10224 RepID=A0ABM0M2D8_SACKO|nr:PREDICTED: betaine--homocysteine S-methyltransferase 1-like [Saccoglossus kowalevskii]
MPRVGLLERLKSGRPVIGDGSFVFTLEKRGYVKAGPWTSEAAYQYPDAVRQLSREFVRAGADVVQTFTFYATDDKLQDKGLSGKNVSKDIGNLTSKQINSAACDIAREVADEGDALVCGGISPTPGYIKGIGKEAVQKEFDKQCEVFIEKDVDFLLAEFFGHVEELEWGMEVLKKYEKPVAATMRISTIGDMNGVSTAECAIRMAKSGADVVGINCLFDPENCIKTMKVMKSALNEAGLNPFLMAQPVGFHTHEANEHIDGYMALPEFPFALESRIITRAEAHKFAREAYELGIRYIGGCCGFEPYHIRAIAEELAEERGFRPPGHDKNSLWGKDIAQTNYKIMVHRVTKEYWMNLNPGTGRPEAHILSKLDKIDETE